MLWVFLSIGNLLGETAACFLAQNHAQGAPPSPFLFETTYDPSPTLIWALQCDCTVEALGNPSGSSPFADDMSSDASDAIQAMPPLCCVCASWSMLKPTYSG